MIFITKYRHNKIVGQYEEAIKDLKEALYRKDELVKIVDKLVDRSITTDNTLSSLNGCIMAGELILPNDVPRYVEDYFGGKVIKQEATPVTILDEQGKATYGLTAKKASEGRLYILEQK